MSTTAAPVMADEVIATLRAHEAELRAAGLKRLSLFGSVARGDHEADSDVDLAVEFDRSAQMDLFQLFSWNGAWPRSLAVPSIWSLSRCRKSACRQTSTEIAGMPSRHDPVDSLADHSGACCRNLGFKA